MYNIVMAICIFPGTFNPIHEGHIKMAEFALKQYKFEKIIFIPSYLPPHKDIDKVLTQHRYKMVEIAVKSNPKFEVSDIEYSSEGKSYSLITVKKLIENYKLTPPINFIIGTDAFAGLDKWYHAEELKKLVHFIVFPRIGNYGENVYNKYKEAGWDFEVVPSEYINISSTEIRNGSLKGEKKEIKDYIEKHGLYKN